MCFSATNSDFSVKLQIKRFSDKYFRILNRGGYVMAKKISNPDLFTAATGVNEKQFAKAGLFDPVLTADTPLFIDPMLLASSTVPEMVDAEKTYKKFFGDLLKLLIASKKEDDVAWKAAKKMLSFHEVSGTCLGYGAGSIRGSGWAEKLTNQLLLTAKEIVSMGITDPDLFMMLGLFEEGIGPDRISDMVTNVIRFDLIRLNERIAKEFGLATERFELNGIAGALVRNPRQYKSTPVVLVAKDVLRALPIALDYDDVIENAQRNAALRDRLNKEIGDVWKAAHSAEEKHNLRTKLLASKDAIAAWLEAIKISVPEPYDLETDTDGLVRWAHVAATVATEYPKVIALATKKDLPSMRRIVDDIIEQYRFLNEDRDLWKEMWLGKRPRSEKTAQRLFFAVAHSYCTANKLDITPEAETGNGPVDFKFSTSNEARILVEIKLSKGNVVHGYEVQLPTYMAAEKADGAFVVLDVGSLGKKLTQVTAIRTKLLAGGQNAATINYIDCLPKASASVRKKI